MGANNGDYVYSIDVSNQIVNSTSKPYSQKDRVVSVAGVVGSTTNFDYHIGDYWHYPYTWHSWDWSTYPYSKTIYKYQLICPRCGKTNWAEIDKVVVCACGARLKAVTNKVDYEIPVNK